MTTTEFVKVEKELVAELDKRGLELVEAYAELAVDYIITTRCVIPSYNVNQYVTDTLSHYPEMLIEK